MEEGVVDLDCFPRDVLKVMLLLGTKTPLNVPLDVDREGTISSSSSESGISVGLDADDRPRFRGFVPLGAWVSAEDDCRVATFEAAGDC